MEKPIPDSRKSDRGLVIVYTGNGKGKTTAALGLCLRGAGHGNKISLIQFIKGEWEYGELKGLARLAPEVTVKTMGVGCVGILGDNKPIEEHRQAAAKALDVAREAIFGGRYDTVILDEINVAVHLGLVAADDVFDMVIRKPATLNLVLTGRYADERFITLADMVTEMKDIKHPFQKGVSAKKGIDF